MFKLRSLTQDAKPLKGKFKPSTAAERRFMSQLRKVARASSHIVEAHVEGHEIKYPREMQKALDDYARTIVPWAARQSANMLKTVGKANKKNYAKASKQVGTLLKLNVAEADVGAAATQMMLEQVGLITSIPIEAGIRAQELALEAVMNGTRASEIAEKLKNTTSVTHSRATLIARTETARANASFTQSRAAAIGAQAYTWRTTMDGAERHSHAKMNGKVVRYDSPPTLIDGTTGHAGTFPNCRCYQDPIFDD